MSDLDGLALERTDARCPGRWQDSAHRVRPMAGPDAMERASFASGRGILKALPSAEGCRAGSIPEQPPSIPDWWHAGHVGCEDWSDKLSYRACVPVQSLWSQIETSRASGRSVGLSERVSWLGPDVG